MSLILVSRSFGAPAQTQIPSTKALAWDLGGVVRFASVEYAENIDQAEVDVLFNNTVRAAKDLGISLLPLPAKTDEPRIEYGF